MENFVAGMERLLTPGFEAKLHLVFALLDSDRDDLVSKEEISRALSHVPLNEVGCHSTNMSRSRWRDTRAERRRWPRFYPRWTRVWAPSRD